MEFLQRFWSNLLWPYMTAHPLRLLIYVFGFYVCFRLFVRFYRYLFALLRSRHLVYLQVVLPREDSPKDKDKASEKDFREKIAVMEQLYRSLYEIRELNLRNIIRRMIFQYNFVSFEFVAKKQLIEFYVVCEPKFQHIVEKQITSFYSDAAIEEVKPYTLTSSGFFTKAYHLYTKQPFWYPLKTYKTIENDPLNDLTNVLSRLDEHEYAIIQILFTPRSPKWNKKAEKMGTALFKGKEPSSFRIPGLGFINTIFQALIFGYERSGLQGTNAPGASSGDPYIRMLQRKEDVTKQIGEKTAQSGFDVCIRALATAKTKQKAGELTDAISVAFNVYKDELMNWFQMRRLLPLDRLNAWLMTRRIIMHMPRGFLERRSLLVPEELASIFHFPNSRYNYTPIIRWLTYKVLPPPPILPEDGILLGYNTYRGEKRAVHFRKKDRARHHYMIGQTGTGKSTYLGWLVRQDIINGEGVCVVDPHGDLVEDILKFIPKNRVKDVIVFDPSDQDRPMGLNILEADTPEQMDMASSQATEIFIKLFGDEIFGPRIQHYFRNACLTLMEDKEEGATLIDVPRIFVDNDFMKYKVTKTKNPVVRSFWEHEYAQTGDRERQEMIPYFSAKFGPFITNSIMRNTIGQKKSAFNFRHVMDEGKILLINLSKGKIGDLNTQLLGLVIVSRLQMAAMSRTDIPEKQRKDFYLYVDEFQSFATDSFASILAEARKYHLILIMAHQYINQLVQTKYGVTSTQIRDAVFGNVGTLQSFKVGAEDAEYLAKEYAPVLTEQDVIGIPNYKTYIRLNIDNASSRPFSIDTIYDTTGESEKIAKIAKEYSRMKYGRRREFVDQEIFARIGIEL